MFLGGSARPPDTDAAARGMQIKPRPAAVDGRAKFALVPVAVVWNGKVRPHASAAGGRVQIHMNISAEAYVDASSRSGQTAVLVGLAKQRCLHAASGSRRINRAFRFPDLNASSRSVRPNPA